MTMAPDCTAMGASPRDRCPRAEKCQIDILEGVYCPRVWTAISWRNLKVLPAERADARSFTDEAGKFRRSIT